MSKSELQLIEHFIKDRPPIHIRQDGTQRCVGLNSKALAFLYSNLKVGMNSLETGCGLSTLLFAYAQCFHTSIVPNESHIAETKRNAGYYNIDLGTTTFIQSRSEFFLPSWIADKKLEVILIDGGHAFPLPMIDWFYTQGYLSKSGLLVLDDIGLRSVNVLFKFLKIQPEWQLIRIIHKTAFFRKLSDQSNEIEWDYWKQQPFNRGIDTRWRQLYYGLKHRLRF